MKIKNLPIKVVYGLAIANMLLYFCLYLLYLSGRVEFPGRIVGYLGEFLFFIVMPAIPCFFLESRKKIDLLPRSADAPLPRRPSLRSRATFMAFSLVWLALMLWILFTKCSIVIGENIPLSESAAEALQISTCRISITSRIRWFWCLCFLTFCCFCRLLRN